MIGAPKLIGRIVGRQLPVRALHYALRNRINLLLGNGDRRFEFERLYLEDSDPWDFTGSAYERDKYQRVLTRIAEFRRSAERALEIGCSIGIFSKMLAAEFKTLVAVDFSAEALARARQCCREPNIFFVHSNVLSLDLASSFDVIVCAEILYYLAPQHETAVCRQLQHHLTPNGIVVMVSGDERTPDPWEQALNREFTAAFREVVPDGIRPYKLVIFERK